MELEGEDPAQGNAPRHPGFFVLGPHARPPWNLAWGNMADESSNSLPA